MSLFSWIGLCTLPVEDDQSLHALFLGARTSAGLENDIWLGCAPRGSFDNTPSKKGSLGSKKDSQSQKIARTAPKNFLNNSRALPSKTRALSQIAPESSAKSPSHEFFVVAFLSLILRRVLEIAFEKVLRSSGFSREEWFLEGVLNWDFREGPKKAETRLSRGGPPSHAPYW